MANRLLLVVLLAFPSVVLIALAVPRFFAGLALDETFPVPAGIESNRFFSRQEYLGAAALLSLTEAADGETQVMRAQSLWLSGARPAAVLPIATQAMTRSPTSIQGWTLLAEILKGSDPARAAKALSIALELSPYDYWLVGRKTRAGAVLWDELAPDARAQLLSQAGLLWTQKEMRPQILSLVRIKGGAALLTRAVADPDQIRAINRYVAHLRLGIP